MKKKQDFFSKQQYRWESSAGLIRKPQKNSWNGMLIFILIVIVGLLLALGYYILNKDTFQQPLIPEIATTDLNNSLTIGAEIQKEWILKEDNSDLVAYTHTLTTTEGEIYLLKSKKIPLNNYSISNSGTFQIIWIIETMYQGKALIEVDRIKSLTEDITENPTIPSTTITQNPGIHLENAGLYFGQDFFDTFVFVGQAGSNGIIEIKNLENEKLTKIEFFNCSETWENNCKELTRTFKETWEKATTTSNGDTFYKLAEVQTRYFQNNNRRGYFINNADDQEVEKIKNLITITNPEYIKQLVTLYGIKACLGQDDGLNKISTHTIKKSNNKLLVIMEWTGEKQFQCETTLDLSNPNKFSLIDLKLQTSWVNTTTWTTNEPNQIPSLPEQQPISIQTWEHNTSTTQATTKESSYNPNVKQFPINPEKTLTYTSSRGQYTMSFPSMNIAYEAFNTDEDFGQAGLRCHYGIRVIQYKNKDLIASEPTIIIHECSSKNEIQLPGENYLIKELGEKKFLITIRDSAWLDFAKNILIQLLPSV